MRVINPHDISIVQYLSVQSFSVVERDLPNEIKVQNNAIQSDVEHSVVLGDRNLLNPMKPNYLIHYCAVKYIIGLFRGDKALAQWYIIQYCKYQT